MKIPAMRGIIERRILANYRVDPEILEAILPSPFRPKLINGLGVAGICLIRLNHVRPAPIGASIGLRSENAAHRIAVEWDDDAGTHEGVYIPRRDTSSFLSVLTGGHLFPGIHHHAQFDVVECEDRFHVGFESDDRQTHVIVEGQLATVLPANSIFQSLEVASRFFEAGSLGYSATTEAGKYHGLQLKSWNWKIEPLAVLRIESSFFDNPVDFPPDSINFDCALIMRNIAHEWRAQETLCVDRCVQ